MKLKVLNNMGNELGTVDAPSELLVEKNSDGLMHTVLKSYKQTNVRERMLPRPGLTYPVVERNHLNKKAQVVLGKVLRGHL